MLTQSTHLLLKRALKPLFALSLSAAALSLYSGLSAQLSAAPSAQATALKLGELAPDFSLKDQRGQELKLSSLRGKLVVLEWTNPTCPFVVRHYKAKTMTTLAQSHPDVVWLTINSSHFTQDADNAKWADSEGVKRVLNDASGEVGQRYRARTTPHMYVIDAAGKLAYQGAIDDDPYGDKQAPLNYVAEALKALKAGAQPKVGETKPYGCSVKYKR
jgi:peroxiredoxin